MYTERRGEKLDKFKHSEKLDKKNVLNLECRYQYTNYESFSQVGEILCRDEDKESKY